jgi:hypothetical protein
MVNALTFPTTTRTPSTVLTLKKGYWKLKTSTNFWWRIRPGLLRLVLKDDTQSNLVGYSTSNLLFRDSPHDTRTDLWPKVSVNGRWFRLGELISQKHILPLSLTILWGYWCLVLQLMTGRWCRFVNFEHQWADFLTKPLPSPRLTAIRETVGIVPALTLCDRLVVSLFVWGGELDIFIQTYCNPGFFVSLNTLLKL